ncbi:hypothetical protein EYF80_019399 [Liparis tanakae]|uniref:Uncharacterized protein n=1 Tax=Liparis tanakae TaxID=230148 RepID=A0A4Z2HZH6_9TELE|nr:hypothetical protein EYF80_019399 [Liparis tanakae]
MAIITKRNCISGRSSLAPRHDNRACSAPMTTGQCSSLALTSYFSLEQDAFGELLLSNILPPDQEVMLESPQKKPRWYGVTAFNSHAKNGMEADEILKKTWSHNSVQRRAKLRPCKTLVVP